MSYLAIANMAESPSLRRRLTACAAEQKKPQPYASWVAEHAWDIAVTPGWAAKWASAMAAQNEDPGSDPGVITDVDILGAVQPMGVEPETT